jgi:sirohydrochlorin ferrochelatase
METNNASNEELPQEDQEQGEEAPWRCISHGGPGGVGSDRERVERHFREHREQWSNYGQELTERQQAHVAERTARKAREQAEASARWGKKSKEE